MIPAGHTIDFGATQLDMASVWPVLAGVDRVILGRGLSDQNHKKEELSYAYLHAIAAAAGFSVTRPNSDNDSVDAVVEGKGKIWENAVVMSPRLEIQLKATARKDPPETSFTFPLPIKNYNDLRGTTALPRILVILVLPIVEKQWLRVTKDALTARHCAYWLSIHGMPETPNKTKRTVTLQCANVLTPDSLRALMRQISTGERTVQ